MTKDCLKYFWRPQEHKDLSVLNWENLIGSKKKKRIVQALVDSNLSLLGI